MATTASRASKRGPAPSPGRVRVTVYLDQALAEWGKQQDGGLSELLRRLLDQAQHEQGQTADRYPPELRAAYQRLIDRKLTQGLLAEEEQELARVRERINAIDRDSAQRRRFEAGADAIDQELADLRRTILAQPRKTRP